MMVPATPSFFVRVTGKEHSGVVGTATVRAFDLAMLLPRPDCTATLKTLGAGDADYAAAEEIARGRSASGTSSTRDTFSRAAERYLSAERALTAPGDRALRGQAARSRHVEYFDLRTGRKRPRAKALHCSAKTVPARGLMHRRRGSDRGGSPSGRPVPGYEGIRLNFLTRARPR